MPEFDIVDRTAEEPEDKPDSDFPYNPSDLGGGTEADEEPDPLTAERAERLMFTHQAAKILRKTRGAKTVLGRGGTGIQVEEIKALAEYLLWGTPADYYARLLAKKRDILVDTGGPENQHEGKDDLNREMVTIKVRDAVPGMTTPYSRFVISAYPIVHADGHVTLPGSLWNGNGFSWRFTDGDEMITVLKFSIPEGWEETKTKQ